MPADSEGESAGEQVGEAVDGVATRRGGGGEEGDCMTRGGEISATDQVCTGDHQLADVGGLGDEPMVVV